MADPKGLGDIEAGQIESNYDETTDSFDAMNLKSELLRGVYAYGLECPSAIQQRAIMPIIKGKEVIAQAQSGAGKTTAFSISVLQMIDPDVEACQALILAPTRQISQEIQKVVVAISDSMQLGCHACIGGTSLPDDIKALQDSPQIVVGTPGRVHDLIQRCVLKIDMIKIFVLDEADEILSRGFAEQVYDIFPLLPQSIQVVILSATIPQDVTEFTSKFMRDPTQILVKNC